VIDRLHSYPKVWTLGHAAVKDLLDGPVAIQEKIDGSQFTFGMVGGELHCRSKGARIHLPTTDKLFKGACETAQALFDAEYLIEGWQYRCEAMMGPRHNTLEYARPPKGNLILFDVDTGLEDRVPPDHLREIGDILSIEVVPTLYEGNVHDLPALRSLLECESCLGGAKVEGIVIKNYARWGEDGKMLMGKLVSEAFKEKHQKAWQRSNPGRGDVLERLKDTYRSERRWEKAVQHLREAGELENSPRDIGPLLNEVKADIVYECRAEIADALFKAFWPKIKRGVTAGLPEWYKARLAERQFEADEAELVRETNHGAASPEGSVP
jgi:hypothetical protein